MPISDTSPSSSPDIVSFVDVILLDQLTTISICLAIVQALNYRRHTNPTLKQTIVSVKRAQCERFRCTYQDILAHADMRHAGEFFLSELYGEKDFSKRDAQFSRITSSLQRLFPVRVQDLTLKLLQLHALSEQLDHAMASALLRYQHQPSSATIRFSQYLGLWHEVGSSLARKQQLALVSQIGAELTLLTKAPGLRSMLKMMRGPALLSGLSDLQIFLETGFDVFSNLQSSSTGVGPFMQAIESRESLWIDHLFKANPSIFTDQSLWPELESLNN